MTIMEMLCNAEYNLKSSIVDIRNIGLEQLSKALILLSKEYGLHDNINEILSKYPNLEDAPDLS